MPDVVYLRDIVDVEALNTAIDAGLVVLKPNSKGNLWLLNYTPAAQFSRSWSPEVKLCRGLIISGPVLDPDTLVVARPFAKFGNIGEYGPESAFGELPVGLAMEAFEKVDGSLAIVYYDGENYAIATRGSFSSTQAVAATKLWRAKYSDVVVPSGVTLLFEYVAPWNRIVVAYGEEDLIFLGAIDNATGADVEFDGWPGTRTRRFSEAHDIEALLSYVESNDTAANEGFVIRFVPSAGEPSVRAKVKYAEYLRLHRLVTGVSTVTIWEHLSQGRSLKELLEKVPDEFYKFVTQTMDELNQAHGSAVARAYAFAEDLKGLDRKSAAALITAQKDPNAWLVFAALDKKDVSALAWKKLRPEFAVPMATGELE
jgi:RNA ligase